MRIALAIFDPSQPAPDGSFWSWRAASLDRKLLDRLYYDVAIGNRPEDPNQLDDSVVIGGFAAFAPDWLFAYRFGNGGRDARGRPGRFVMVIAGVRLDQASGIDLSMLMTCPAVVDVLIKAAYSCPVPAPAELDVDVIVQPSRVDPVLVAKALRDERLELSGPEAVSQAVSLCVSLPIDRQWSCRLRMDREGNYAVVECPQGTEKSIAPPRQSEATERTKNMCDVLSGSPQDRVVSPQSHGPRSHIIYGWPIAIISLIAIVVGIVLFLPGTIEPIRPIPEILDTKCLEDRGFFIDGLDVFGTVRNNGAAGKVRVFAKVFENDHEVEVQSKDFYLNPGEVANFSFDMDKLSSLKSTITYRCWAGQKSSETEIKRLILTSRPAEISEAKARRPSQTARTRAAERD